MYTYKAIIFYILQKNYNFFLSIIISIDNQTLTITEITILKKNRVLLSSKCINTSTKLITTYYLLINKS